MPWREMKSATNLLTYQNVTKLLIVREYFHNPPSPPNPCEYNIFGVLWLVHQ